MTVPYPNRTIDVFSEVYLFLAITSIDADRVCAYSVRHIYLIEKNVADEISDAI